MNFTNPAQLFLQHHSVTSLDDIVAYTDFLRHQVGVGAKPPIELSKIYTHFGIAPPNYAPLPNQQGLTIFNRGVPTIIVNEADKETRQRFTQAHELIEILFSELPGDIRMDRLKENIFGTRKERICQLGAANLLMPAESYFPKASQMGVSFHTAELLASEFEVSLIAALFRIADLFPNLAAVVLWKMKNKPSELDKRMPKEQIQLPGFAGTSLPSPKLRVEWSYGKVYNTFIPDHKSVDPTSSVYLAWESGQFTICEESSPFGRYSRPIKLENKPVIINNEKCVLSLIREP